MAESASRQLSSWGKHYYHSSAYNKEGCQLCFLNSWRNRENNDNNEEKL